MNFESYIHSSHASWTSGQDEAAQELIQPHVKQVVLTLLDIIRETENDDLTTVLQKIVCTYVDEVMPIAVEMTDHLAKTFQQVLLLLFL